MPNMNTAQQTPAAPKPAQKAPDPVPPPEFVADKILALGEAGLIAILKDSGSTVFQKAKACQRLANVGTNQAVPALAALLSDEQLAHYARYGLETIPDPAVEDALRAALPKLKGKLQAGVINSIAMRHDGKALPALAKLMHEPAPEPAGGAAAAAIGKIGGLEAARLLEDGLNRAKPAMRPAVAAAALVCAEGLLGSGQRDRGLALYAALAKPDVHKPVRLAAMQAIIAAEVSLNRPR